MMATTLDDLFPHLSTENRSFLLTLLSFPIEFSVDWFPSEPPSRMTELILAMHSKKWIEQKKNCKGFFSWTQRCPRQEILGRASKEERARHYRHAADILKRNQPESEEAILEIARQCILAGVQEDDLDTILHAADLEDRKHHNVSAIRLYEIVLNFIETLAAHEKKNLSDWHRRSFIQAAESRTALAMFYPNREKLWKWFALAEQFAVALDDKKRQASLYLLIGQNYCITLQMHKALKYLQQARDIIALLGDEELSKRSLKLQLLFYINDGDLSGAIEAYEQSVGSIESFEDFFSLYAALGMAFTFTEGGMPQRGLGICTSIRNQMGSHENKAIMGASLVLEAVILFQIRELASSRRCFEEALTCLKGEKDHWYESVARIGLICIDALEGHIRSAAFAALQKFPKKTWYHLLNFFYLFEGVFTLYHRNIERFEDKHLFGFLRRIGEDQLFPRTYLMIRRLQIMFPERPLTAEEKIEKLLELEKIASLEYETFEHTSIQIELARLYLQINHRKQAEALARKIWKFLNPIARKAFPSDLRGLIQTEDRLAESNLINLVIEMGKALTRKDSIEQLLTGIITSISRMTGAERAALFIWNEAFSSLDIAASRNLIPEDIRKEEFKKSLEAIRRASQSDRPEIREFQLDGIDAIETRKAIITPLVLDGKTIGVLYQDGRFFHIGSGSETREILAAVASQIAVSIDRARAHDEIAALNRKLVDENLYYQDEKEEFRPFGEIIGCSKATLGLQRLILKVAPTQSTVLIWGETGVGKELVARAVHRESPRKDKPFIRVNCAALPDSLIESELFGHEKGAFTGALRAKAGRFELADQGTIFLDEISELPLPTQSKLLRILQEKEFQRVGGTKLLHSDFRLITATNKDLRKEVENGRFREDLFYRLNVYPVFVPPLRERPEDIPLLALHFLDLFSTLYNKRYSGIATAEMERLKTYAWPGNIRELSNVIERAVISGGTKLKFPELQKSGLSSGAMFGFDGGMNLKDQEKRFTTNLIREALLRSGGRIGGKAGAAELLGMKRSALTLRMQRLGIKVEHKRTYDGE